MAANCPLFFYLLSFYYYLRLNFTYFHTGFSLIFLFADSIKSFRSFSQFNYVIIMIPGTIWIIIISIYFYIYFCHPQPFKIGSKFSLMAWSGRLWNGSKMCFESWRLFPLKNHIFPTRLTSETAPHPFRGLFLSSKWRTLVRARTIS